MKWMLVVPRADTQCTLTDTINERL